MGIFEDKLRRDLALRGIATNTIETYVRCCRRYCAHHRRAPIELSAADVRAYLEHLRVVERKKPRSLNHRIQDVSADAVRFATRDGKHATLRPAEFVRRFVLHVLPAGFVKIRHFGLLAPANVGDRLASARQRLEEKASREPVAPPTPMRAPRSGAEVLSPSARWTPLRSRSPRRSPTRAPSLPSRST